MIEGDKLPILRANRVLLRWLTAEDVPALFGIFSDPTVMRYWSSPPLEDEAAAAELLEEIHRFFREKTLFQWGVALEDGAKANGSTVIGTCTLLQMDTENRRAELGFALGRAYWGHGYMTEALHRLLDFAFGDLDLRRLEADVDPRNDGSLRMMERLGFEREGYLRERWVVGGEVQDSVLYGLLRRDWKPD